MIVGGERLEESGVARRIVTVLRQRIVHGELLPKTPLRQDRIAAEFSASHVPVREAFRTLEGEGLIVREPRRGVHVAPLEPAAVREVAAMRAALEVVALRRMTPETLGPARELARVAQRRLTESTDMEVWEQANREFHRALVAPCGMPRLVATIDDLIRASARSLHTTWRTSNWKPGTDGEHDLILLALDHGDIETAATHLSRHILGAGEVVARQLEAYASRKAVP